MQPCVVEERPPLCAVTLAALPPSCIQAATNLAESATGIDIDHGGDVGLTSEDTSRARQLLASEATCEATNEATSEATLVRHSKPRLDKVAGELPTIMLLYLNGETPPYKPYSTPP